MSWSIMDGEGCRERQPPVRGRFEDRSDEREGGGVGIVAIDAVIPFAGTAAEVPMSGHSAVGTMPVVAVLRPVALGAELHGVRELHPPAVGEPEPVVVFGMVATQAGEIAVRVGQALMKLVEVGGCPRVGARRRGGVDAQEVVTGRPRASREAGVDPGGNHGPADVHRVPDRGGGRARRRHRRVRWGRGAFRRGRRRAAGEGAHPEGGGDREGEQGESPAAPVGRGNADAAGGAEGGAGNGGASRRPFSYRIPVRVGIDVRQHVPAFEALRWVPMDDFGSRIPADGGIIGGVLVRLSDEPEASARALRELRARAEILLGEPWAPWLPLALKADGPRASRDLHEWIADLPGVRFVEVVAVHFEADFAASTAPAA